MAREVRDVVVPRPLAANGGLPAVCVRSGRPADVLRRVPVRRRPPAFLLAVLLGPLGIGAGRWLARDGSSALLPVATAAVRRHLLALAGTVLLLGVAFALAGAAENDASGPVLVVASVAVACLALLPARQLRSVPWVTPGDESTVVVLSAHPAFATAVDALLADGAGTPPRGGPAPFTP